jgi:hypothetical protein
VTLPIACTTERWVSNASSWLLLNLNVVNGGCYAAGELERVSPPLTRAMLHFTQSLTLPSLVSCPIYLTPATTKTKTIRLNRIWVPSEEPAPSDRKPGRQPPLDERSSSLANVEDEDEPEPIET